MLHHAKADFIFMNFLMTIFANIKEVTKYAPTFDIISFVGFSCNIVRSGPYLKFRIVNFLSWLLESVMRERVGNVNKITVRTF